MFHSNACFCDPVPCVLPTEKVYVAEGRNQPNRRHPPPRKVVRIIEPECVVSHVKITQTPEAMGEMSIDAPCWELPRSHVASCHGLLLGKPEHFQ